MDQEAISYSGALNDLDEKYMVAAATRLQQIFKWVEAYEALFPEDKLCKAFNSTSFRTQLVKQFEVMDYETKFIIFYILLDQSETVKQWIEDVLKIQKDALNEIDFSKQFLEFGDLSANEFLVEMIIEIFLSTVKPECLGKEDKIEGVYCEN